MIKGEILEIINRRGSITSKQLKGEMGEKISFKNARGELSKLYKKGFLERRKVIPKGSGNWHYEYTLSDMGKKIVRKIGYDRWRKLISLTLAINNLSDRKVRGPKLD